MIREKMIQLFDALGEEPSESDLRGQCELIIEIGELARSTTAFKDYAVQFEAFKSKLEADVVPGGRFVAAWSWLMDRIASAPTSFHMQGSVVLLMPMVADYLKQEVAQ